jgi:hypothetical protein
MGRPIPTSKYKKVEVLLLRWDDEGDLGIEYELKDLERLFSKSYNFSTRQFLIPSKASHLALMGRALDFIQESESEECLLIIYYGGYSFISSTYQTMWQW